MILIFARGETMAIKETASTAGCATCRIMPKERAFQYGDWCRGQPSAAAATETSLSNEINKLTLTKP
jgi:hypothetical protein